MEVPPGRYLQRIPQELISDLTLKKGDISVDTFIKRLEDTFGCKIDFLTNRRDISEIKWFLLGDIHVSQLHTTINTLFLMLFGKEGDKIVHEGSSLHLTEARPMVDLNALSLKLQSESWDCMPDTDFFVGTIENIRILGVISSRLIHLIEHCKYDYTFLYELRELLHSANGMIYRIQNLLNLELLGKIYKNYSFTNPVSTVFQKTVQNIEYVLSSLNYWIEQSWKQRQKSLCNSLVQRQDAKDNTFLLAGQRHLTTTEMKFEEHIASLMQNTPAGYLAIKINVDYSSNEKIVDLIHESAPTFQLNEFTTFDEINENLSGSTVLLDDLGQVLLDFAIDFDYDEQDPELSIQELISRATLLLATTLRAKNRLKEIVDKHGVLTAPTVVTDENETTHASLIVVGGQQPECNGEVDVAYARDKVYL